MDARQTASSNVTSSSPSHRQMRRGKIWRKGVGVLAAVTLSGPALFIGAAPAQAAETGVYTKNNVLEVRAGAGTTNRIVVELVKVSTFDYRIKVIDTGGKVVPGGKCTRVDNNTAYCPLNSFKSIAIRTLDGNDRINTDVKISTWVNAGEGNDYIDLHSASDTAYGGPGDDQMYGWSGNDRLYGESGNDTIYGHKDNDTLYGGDGTDTMYGGEGSDTIRGEASRDFLYGEAGKDNVYGDSGPDLVSGGADNDTVDGGSDKDNVFGGRGDDGLLGGDGDDRLYGKDDKANNDKLWGQNGKDYCEADPGDAKNTCES